MSHHPERLQQLFPQDKGLIDWCAESYCGVPLLDPSGGVVGHLAIIDDKPMHDGPRGISVMRIFAARARAEIERKCAEAALRDSEARLARILDSAMDAIVTFDAEPTHRAVQRRSREGLRLCRRGNHRRAAGAIPDRRLRRCPRTGAAGIRARQTKPVRVVSGGPDGAPRRRPRVPDRGNHLERRSRRARALHVDPARRRRAPAGRRRAATAAPAERVSAGGDPLRPQRRRDRRPEPCARRSHGESAPGREHRFFRARPRRDRYRQGADRPRHPRAQQAQAAAADQGQLCGAARRR